MQGICYAIELTLHIRSLIATLHFKENFGREPAKTAAGADYEGSLVFLNLNKENVHQSQSQFLKPTVTVPLTGNVASIHMRVMLVSSRGIILCNVLYNTCGTSQGYALATGETRHT